MENYEDFYQVGPQLSNQYTDDLLLQSYLNRVLPKEILDEIEPDLKHLGQRVSFSGDIHAMGLQAEQEEPYLKQYDVWGRKINEVVVSSGWTKLDKVSAEEGLVAIGYERVYKELSRIYQFAKLYLFTPSSAIYTCPLAMSDGAAKLIEVYGDQELKNSAFKRLTSRDPNKFWTSTQQMTERTGGSDVARALTLAEKNEGTDYKLYGHKWFVSAITAQMGMTLAKIKDEDGKVTPGSKGLSLFYLEMRNKDGTYNSIEIEALKDKLGTRALPTAQISLQGSKARLIGDKGNGVKKIATLFNITRIYNALTAVSFMKRGIALSKDYASKREAFSKLIIDHPLHILSLARMQIELEGAFHLTFFEVTLLGKEECGQATNDDKALLRLLTPISKLYTAKQCIEVVSSHLETIGGIAYLEESGLPKLLRDAQVLSIWEGTPAIMALDMLRAIKKEQAFSSFVSFVKNKLTSIKNVPALQSEKQIVMDALERVKTFFSFAESKGPDYLSLTGIDLLYSLARVIIAVLLLKHAQWCNENGIYPNSMIIAKEWCKKDLTPIERLKNSEIDHFKAII